MEDRGKPSSESRGGVAVGENGVAGTVEVRMSDVDRFLGVTQSGRYFRHSLDGPGNVLLETPVCLRSVLFEG
jgi:hypothetical protein